MKILDIKRERNSIYGNPCWEVIAIQEDGSVLRGKTASNAVLGYEMTLSWVGRDVNLAFHRTPKGRIVFDRVVK